MTDVHSKYEQFQELFATLINEMQTASENEGEGSKASNSQILVKRISPELEDGRREAMSTQMS